MFEIILKTWYQETPETRYDEVLDKKFDDIGDAVQYLALNIERLRDEFPIDSEITIKYNHDHKK